jgi:hypothetical protein
MVQSEGRTFINAAVYDEHEPIDLMNDGQVRYWCERLSASPDEIRKAVTAVGPNCTAVAIWLGSAQPL